MRDNIYAFKLAKPQDSTPAPVGAYPGEVWMIEDIASHLRMPKKSLYQVVNRPGFPAPIGNMHRGRRWLAHDVKNYFREISKNPHRERSRLPIDVAHDPVSIVFREEMK